MVEGEGILAREIVDLSKEGNDMPTAIVAGSRTQIKPEADRPCYQYVAELENNIDSTFLYFLAVLALPCLAPGRSS